MKKPILIAFISIAVIGAAAWLARPGESQPSDTLPTSVTSTLVASSVSFDFDTISMAKGVVSRDITVRNTGTEAITVGKTYTSCMCTSVAVDINGRKFGPYGMTGMGYIPRINETLAPEQQAVMTVMFDPAAHGPAGVGRIQRTVTMENDGAPVVVSFTANVTP